MAFVAVARLSTERCALSIDAVARLEIHSRLFALTAPVNALICVSMTSFAPSLIKNDSNPSPMLDNKWVRNKRWF